MDKPIVLFLCTGNSARSQMAEAFLRKYGKEFFEARSAGMDPKGLHPLTVRVMNEVGIDLSGHSSKSIKQYLGHVQVRYAITVCANADQQCPRVWPFGAAVLSWPFDDPAACTGSEVEKLEKFREVRDQIEEKIKSWVAVMVPVGR